LLPIGYSPPEILSKQSGRQHWLYAASPKRFFICVEQRVQIRIGHIEGGVMEWQRLIRYPGGQPIMLMGKSRPSIEFALEQDRLTTKRFKKVNPDGATMDCPH
jgi:hypothetical protein